MLLTIPIGIILLVLLILASIIFDIKDFSKKEKVFVYFASLNLLNKYVKEDNCNDNLKNNYLPVP